VVSLAKVGVLQYNVSWFCWASGQYEAAFGGNKEMPHGTLQVKWSSKPLAECRLLGLTDEWEMRIRSQASNVTMMLHVETVLQSGPAHGILQHGDLLLQVTDRYITSQWDMEVIMNTQVGTQLTLLVLRSGNVVEAVVTVEDLCAVTPSRFLFFSGAIFHDMSVQRAMEFNVPCRGLYVADANEPFKLASTNLFRHWIVQKVCDTQISDLETPTSCIETPLDNTWCLDTISPPQAAAVLESIVQVYSFIPIKLDSLDKKEKAGYGIVVHVSGVVLVSRAVVPLSACDVSLTFAETNTIPAKVLVCHPHGNYTLLKYDPGRFLRKVTVARLDFNPPAIGSNATFVTFHQDRQPIIARTTIICSDVAHLPKMGLTPRYRTMNTDTSPFM
jgi:hypothetical protein